MSNKPVSKQDAASSKYKAEDSDEEEDMDYEEKKPRHKSSHNKSHKVNYWANGEF